MPKFEVYYSTECEYVVIVDAEDATEASRVWMDSAYWVSEPEQVSEDMMSTNVYIEEVV